MFILVGINDNIIKKGVEILTLDKKLIGIRIMQKRKECGLKQEELSEKIGYSKNHLSNIERGIYIPTVSFIFKLCNVLGETPDYYLIGRITDKEKSEIVSLLEKFPPDSQKIVTKLISTYLDEIK